jgi:preprotein translocase subunit YajC
MRQRRALVDSLAIGDEIRTGGGIFGTIRRIDDESAIIEVEDGGLLRVVRLAIIAKVEPPG